jgi:hypothetical protein
MQWPYKTTVRFQSFEGIESRLDYWVSATDSHEAERTLQDRLVSDEVFGYRISGRAAGNKRRSGVGQSSAKLRHAARLGTPGLGWVSLTGSG